MMPLQLQRNNNTAIFIQLWILKNDYSLIADFYAYNPLRIAIVIFDGMLQFLRSRNIIFVLNNIAYPKNFVLWK